MSDPTNDIRGVDVHAGLRVRVEYEAQTIHARYSAEPGMNVLVDVESELHRLRRIVRYLEAWLIQWRRQAGEPMEPRKAPEL